MVGSRSNIYVGTLRVWPGTARPHHKARIHGGTDAPLLTPHTQLPPPASCLPQQPPPKLAAPPQLPGNAGMIHLGDFFLLLTEGSKAPQ